MLTDPIADMLTRIRNAHLALHKEVSVPRSKMKEAMATILKQEGYILVDADGFITLTESGRCVAEKIFERHTLLSGILMKLGVSPEVAADDACKIEHAISDESFEAIKRHISKH